MTCRSATMDDCPLLAQWNHQLIQDEGHRNRMTAPQLEERMRGWLKSEYRGVIFETATQPVGYALFRPSADEIYLRQLFIRREFRRQGFGRKAIALLRGKIWPPDVRLTVDVLVKNEAAVAFWRAVGYREYALTLEIMPEAVRSPDS